VRSLDGEEGVGTVAIAVVMLVAGRPSFNYHHQSMRDVERKL
jgi:hypothetical protein